MLGYVSVSKMLGEVSSAELSEWSAYFDVKKQKEKDDKKIEDAKRRAKDNNM